MTGNDFDLDEIRADLEYASSGIDHGDAPYHPHALHAMRAAEQLLTEVERLSVALAAAQSTSYLNPVGTHRYLSTGCLHGNHIYCQTSATRADGTAKVPATCKECGSPCVCLECAHVPTGDQT